MLVFVFKTFSWLVLDLEWKRPIRDTCNTTIATLLLQNYQPYWKFFLYTVYASLLLHFDRKIMRPKWRVINLTLKGLLRYFKLVRSETTAFMAECVLYKKSSAVLNQFCAEYFFSPPKQFYERFFFQLRSRFLFSY